MPTYEFVCEDCGVSRMVKRDILHPSKVLCTHCHKLMRRIFEPAPAIFKDGGTGARRKG